MGKMNIPSSPNFKYTNYKELKGVDYSCDLTEVSRQRTPDGLNMISDEGGNPVKRWGWRTDADIDCGEIFKIVFHEDNVGSYDQLKKYVIASTGIYAVVTTAGVQSIVTLLTSTITSCEYFLFGGELYMFINSALYKIEGATATEAECYVPEVSISRNPDGSGGASLEEINILTPKRKFSFLGNSSSTDYYLYPSDVRTEPEYQYIVSSTVKVELRTASGWEETTEYTLPTATTVTALNRLGVSESISVCEPKIIFSAAHAPLVTGQDNVRISFEAFDNTEHDATNKKGLYKEERLDLLATSHCMTYGYTVVDRVFAVGGKNKNRIYYTGVNEPTYWPDINFMIAGHDNNGVVGLHRIGEYMAVVKADSNIESTVFLVSGSTFDNETFFKVIPTIAGIGAISGKSFASLIDEPLFLSRNGVYAISNYYVTTEKVLRNRSYYVDKKLCAEPNLENACGVTWKKYYLLSINDHCYVLDGRKKYQDKYNNTDFLYECFYWENIPAKCFYVWQNELYFGTSDGRLCKFNTDVPNRTAYCDNGNLTVNADGIKSMTDGEAIPCCWSTPLDDDKYPQYFKTLNKKGTMLTMLPYTRTSAIVKLIKDGGVEVAVGTFYADIFEWGVIDFSRFTFNNDDTAQDAYFKKKVNKYVRLQIKVENNAIYEPFGILGITKTWYAVNFSKKRG